MPDRENSFGRILKRFREQRGLSLRELGLLSDVDHAYIHRLETGEKETPSSDVVERLIRSLKVDERQAKVTKTLVKIDAPQDLVDLVLSDKGIDLRDFESAALIKYRGRARPKWREVIEQIRTLREAIESG